MEQQRDIEKTVRFECFTREKQSCLTYIHIL